MIVKNVIYNKVFSLGNYENEKIGVEIDVQVRCLSIATNV
jgi:hypothetical protein